MKSENYRAHIISIGDELTIGRWQDTNSSWLARQLTDRGWQVVGMSVLPDDEATMVAEMQRVDHDAELIVITGGLGPTADDRTRHALAQAVWQPLVEHSEAWQQVEAAYRRVKPDGEVPASNRRQALMPQHAQVLANDRGTAPGILVQGQYAWFAAMPGVPHEMKAMAELVWQWLEQQFPHLKQPFVSEVAIAGMGESTIQDQLGDLLDPTEELQVGITASDQGHCLVRIRGEQAVSEARAEDIKQQLSQAVLPAGNVAASLISDLKSRQWTMTTAESCTCGQIVARVGAIAGASAVLHQATIAYHNRIKEQTLQVPAELLQQHGAVSQQVVEAMAIGARTTTGADIAIASSGIAGPGGGTPEKPVGTVWLAVAHSQGVISKCVQFPGDRLAVQHRATNHALTMAWQCLQGL